MSNQEVSQTSFKPVSVALPNSERLRAGLVPMGSEVTAQKAIMATERATLMFACWRKTDADTPQVFFDAAVAILADYPEEIIITVTDPRIGLPSRLKWPAQPSEVKEACEELMGPIRRRLEREQRIKDQLAERREFEARRRA